MIQRLTFKLADCFGMRRAAGEHQSRARGRMLAEDRKHTTLVIVAKMKKLFHARMPLNVRSRDNVRISPTRQS